jgi:hypothetical protein
MLKKSYATMLCRSDLCVPFPFADTHNALLVTGDGDDYLYAALKDDAIVVRVKLRSGFFDTEIKPKADAVTSSSLIQSSAAGVFVSGGLAATRFDDDRWHKLSITREVREVNAFSIVACCSL